MTGIIGLPFVVLMALAFGYFEIHKLLLDDHVDEPAPVFAAPNPAETIDSSSMPAPRTSPAPVVTIAGAPAVVPVASDPPVPTLVPTVVSEYAGSFRSLNHGTSGRAVVLGNGTGQRFLRFETFATENGPDLNVYLINSSPGDVFDFIDLGDLTGNVGDQNYEIPPDVDLDVYDTVLIWCVRFSSGFGEAALLPT